MFNAIKEGASAQMIEEHFMNQGINDHILKLNATHNVVSIKLQEIRFDKRMTIGQVKESFEYRFGSPAKN